MEQIIEEIIQLIEDPYKSRCQTIINNLREDVSGDKDMVKSFKKVLTKIINENKTDDISIEIYSEEVKESHRPIITYILKEIFKLKTDMGNESFTNMCNQIVSYIMKVFFQNYITLF